MFKNVISKGKRDLTVVRFFGVFLLLCEFGVDFISGGELKYCGKFFHRNLRLRLRTLPTPTPPSKPPRWVNGTTPFDLEAILDRIDGPKTTTNTTTKVKSTRNTSIITKKRPKNFNTKPFYAPVPTLVAWKWIRTQMKRIPKRKWHLYMPNLTTYDIDAYRREKRRRHREELKKAQSLRVERRKIPTLPKTTMKIYIPSDFNIFIHPNQIKRNKHKDWKYNTHKFNDTPPWEWVSEAKWWNEFVARNSTVAPVTEYAEETRRTVKIKRTTSTTTTKSLWEKKQEREAKAKKREMMRSILSAKRASSTKGTKKITKLHVTKTTETMETIQMMTTIDLDLPSTKERKVKMVESVKQIGKDGKKKIYRDDPSNKEKYRREKQKQLEGKKKNRRKQKKTKAKPKKDRFGAVDKS